MISLHETCLEYFRRRLREGWKCISLEGHKAVLLSPWGQRRELDLRNDVETLRPNEAGDETSIEAQEPDSGEHWDKVADVTPDDGDTDVWTVGWTGEYERDLYELPASGVGSGTINKITVHFRCWGYATGYNHAKASIKSNSAVNDGDEKTFSQSATWENFSQEWANNPADDEAWEWADIDALQIGVSLIGAYIWEGTPAAVTRCTQVYVEVDYSPAVDPPTVTTQAVDDIVVGAATLNGTVTDDGGDTIDYYGFVWDDDSDEGDPGDVDPSTPAGTWENGWKSGEGDYGENPFDHGISGLPAGTTIYVRAAAHNSEGWSYGGVVSFRSPVSYEESCTDGLVVGESLAQNLVIDLALTDGIKPGDSPSSIGTFGMSVADGAELGDTSAITKLIGLLLSDGVSLSDIAQIGLTFERLVSDGVKVGDTPALIKHLNLLATDGVEIGDTPSKQTTFNPALSDGVSLGDTPLAQAIFDNILTDGAKFGDSALGSLLLNLSLADGVILSEALAQMLTLGLSLSDGVKLGDTPLGQLVLDLVLSDGVELGDTPLGQLVLDLTVADGVKLSEALAIIGTYSLSVTDGVKIGDVPLANLVLNLALTDGVELSDLAIYLGRVLLLKIITSQYRKVDTITTQYRFIKTITTHYRQLKIITTQNRLVKSITSMYRKIRTITTGG